MLSFTVIMHDNLRIAQRSIPKPNGPSNGATRQTRSLCEILMAVVHDGKRVAPKSRCQSVEIVAPNGVNFTLVAPKPGVKLQLQ